MGRFGIVFAFLLSVVAAAGSYYLYQGWLEERMARTGAEAKYDQEHEKAMTVQSEKEQIKAEKEQIAAKSEEYRAKAEAMQSQVDKLQADQASFNSEKTALEEKLKSHQAMITELQAKMAELEKKAREAQAACGVSPADLQTNVLGAAPTAAASSASPLVFKPVGSGATSMTVPSVTPAVQETSTQPSSSVASAKSLRELAATAATSGPKVLTVNRKFNFVVINQGLQDGLKMGDNIKVVRNGQEIARVQVEKLYDKFCAASLVEEDPKQQVIEGDEVQRA
jgi:hypothetical protein